MDTAHGTSRKRRWQVLLAAALVPGLVACGGGSAMDPGDRECAAVEHFAEPVLTVTDVVDPDGQEVPTVTLTALVVDGRPELRLLRDRVRSGRPWTPGTTTSDAGLHAGLTIGPDGRVRCDVPCAFGSYPGRVELSVVSESGDRALRRVDVDYRTYRPGCGGTHDDGTDVALRLRPAR